MSELVVNLADPESIALALKVLDMLSDNWPSVGKPSETSELAPASDRRSAQVDFNDDDSDPWAEDAPSSRKPSEGRSASAGRNGRQDADSAPSEAKQSGASASDDDVPWEV